MGTNKDLLKKLEAQRKSKEAHEVKEKKYEHASDKGFARKTIKNVDGQINKLEKKLGKNVISGDSKKMENKGPKKKLL